MKRSNPYLFETDSAEAENILTEKDLELFQMMFDSLDFYVLMLDETHHILFANAAVEKSLDRRPEELLGKYCPSAVHNVEGRFPGCPLEMAVESGMIESVEIFDAGKNKWLDARIYPTRFRTAPGTKVYLHLTQDITEKRTAQKSLQDTLAKLRSSLGAIIQIAQEIIGKRDLYTAGHQKRVADLAGAIATEMRLPEDHIDAIRMAAVIHDIGKIAVPVPILVKPGKLTKEEFALIKEHSRAGYEILKDIPSPGPIADIVLQHHERLDGSGYPQGLKGGQILQEARIIAVADVVEAIASDRPYRPARGIDTALDEIAQGKGRLYDPEAVDACLRLFREKGYRLKA